jgi:hypothetical protein
MNFLKPFINNIKYLRKISEKIFFIFLINKNLSYESIIQNLIFLNSNYFLKFEMYL